MAQLKRLSLSPVLSGDDAAAFTIYHNRCTNISAEKSCSVLVQTKRGLVGNYPEAREYKTKFMEGSTVLSEVKVNVLAKAPVVASYSFASNPAAPEVTLLASERAKILVLSIKNTGNVTARPEFSLDPNAASLSIYINRCNKDIKAGDSCDLVLNAPKKTGDNSSTLKITAGSSTSSVVILAKSPGAVVVQPTATPLVEDLNIPSGFNLVKAIDSEEKTLPSLCQALYQGSVPSEGICDAIGGYTGDYGTKYQDSLCLISKNGESFSDASECTQAASVVASGPVGSVVEVNMSQAQTVQVTPGVYFLGSANGRSLIFQASTIPKLITSAGTLSSTRELSLSGSQPFAPVSSESKVLGSVGQDVYFITSNNSMTSIWKSDLKLSATLVKNINSSSSSAIIYEGSVYNLSKERSLSKISLTSLQESPVSFNLPATAQKTTLLPLKESVAVYWEDSANPGMGNGNVQGVSLGAQSFIMYRDYFANEIIGIKHDIIDQTMYVVVDDKVISYDGVNKSEITIPSVNNSVNTFEKIGNKVYMNSGIYEGNILELDFSAGTAVSIFSTQYAAPYLFKVGNEVFFTAQAGQSADNMDLRKVVNGGTVLVQPSVSLALQSRPVVLGNSIFGTMGGVFDGQAVPGSLEVPAGATLIAPALFNPITYSFKFLPLNLIPYNMENLPFINDIGSITNQGSVEANYGRFNRLNSDTALLISVLPGRQGIYSVKP